MIQMFTKKRNKKGFTLIELIVVIAILGILAAIAIPRLTSATATAGKRSVEATMRTIDSAISIALAENKPATTFNDLVTGGYLAAEPSNPDKVTYAITNKRATVTIEANTYGTHAAVAAGTTLDQLLKLTDW